MFNVDKNLTGIYKITNIITNQLYIGSASVCIVSRWKYHLRDLKANKHHSPKLQNSFNKYGLDSFKFEIIELCQKNKCLDLEQYYLDTLCPFYNICTAAGNCTGRKFSEESKIKMSISAKKRGLNQYLINQQKCKAKFNEFGQKKCTKCLNFKEKFRTKSNVCNDCYNKNRKSRKINEETKLLNLKKRSFGEIIGKNNDETLKFNSLRETERFFRIKFPKFNKFNLKKHIINNSEYYGFKWSVNA